MPSDFLPPPNVTAPAGDPPSASTALPADATPVSPNQHPNPGAPSPGNTSTGFGAPAPALPPVGPVLRAPEPETGGAPAPCVADITVRRCPRPVDPETLGCTLPRRTLGCHVRATAFLLSVVQCSGAPRLHCIQVSVMGLYIGW